MSSSSSPDWVFTLIFNDSTEHHMFVVAYRKKDWVICNPIRTYDGLGVAREGVIKSDHAVIYTGRQAPSPLSIEKPKAGERGMRSRLRMLTSGRPLHPTARVHYREIIMVYHGVRAFKRGHLAATSPYMGGYAGGDTMGHFDKACIEFAYSQDWILTRRYTNIQQIHKRPDTKKDTDDGDGDDDNDSGSNGDDDNGGEGDHG
ncbi:hypothetical protein NA57DRAFT_76215 [Rhizodiscina lignyota]|uniref:DUF6590 domain-containing protein n=1 Tax=Rhizodiscina lignyota TaxID=1504668 RepID=A0A9P4M6K7_9PEZI|nr:hypothetical protein NA57DRAFT_76215 [Rhizodiscina lignyota]